MSVIQTSVCLNTTRRLIHRSRQLDHDIPLLQDLNWLQILEHITFRRAVLVYRFQNGLAPIDLADDLHWLTQVESRRRLRSASTAALIVSATARSTIGDHASLLQPLDRGTAFRSQWRHRCLFQFTGIISRQFFLSDPSRQSNILLYLTLPPYFFRRFCRRSILFLILLCF